MLTFILMIVGGLGSSFAALDHYRNGQSGWWFLVTLAGLMTVAAVAQVWNLHRQPPVVRRREPSLEFDGALARLIESGRRARQDEQSS